MYEEIQTSLTPIREWCIPDVAVVAPRAPYVAGAASPGWVTWRRARSGQHQGSARPAAASVAEGNRLAHSPVQV